MYLHFIFIGFLIACLEPSGKVAAPNNDVLDGSLKDARNYNLSFNAAELKDVSLTESPSYQLWIDGIAYYILNNQGDLVLYNGNEKVFSEAIRVDNAQAYTQLFNFGPVGWQSIKDSSIEYYLATENIFLEQNIKTAGLKVLSVFPGGIILSSANSLTFIRKVGADFRSTNIAMSLRPSMRIGACESACDLWLFDGDDLSTGKIVKDSISWSKTDYKIDLAKDENLSNIYFKIKKDSDGSAFVDDASAYRDGVLYVLDKRASVDTAFTWESLQLLSREYCLPCHGEDGFELESTWATLKDEMIKRMDGSEGFNQMPPPQTDYGKKMTASARRSMVSFLEISIDAKDGSGFGSSDDAPDKMIEAKLKQLADNYLCTSCHADAIKESWWKLNKDDTSSRISSGNMPRNMSLSETQKAELIELIRDL